jgi:peptidoglycan/LPS O-acetylase OafA/YrhL
MPQNFTTQYRPEIDGLRAIAVLAVIFFHAGVLWIPGGFVGVDIFFVISGYLITQIIVKGLCDSKFSFVEFYARRIKRLLPAAFFMLIATVLLGVLILEPQQYLELAKSAVYTSGFAANFWFTMQSGYFDQSTDISPLVHMWSLAVEEQFYLLTPFLLYVAYKLFYLFGIRILICSILIVSLLFSIVFSAEYPNHSFYLLHTRAWEMCLGAIIVLFPQLRPQNKTHQNILALTGILFLAFSFMYISHEMPYPSSVAIFPTLGTLFLLASVTSKRVIGYSFLTSKPIVLVGKFSYSAYLWHWPLIVYYRIYISERAFTGLETFCLVMVSLLLGYLSWRFIEEKFRYFNGAKREVFSYGSTAIGLMFLVPFLVYLAKGLPSRVSDEAQAISGRDIMWNFACGEQIKLYAELDELFCVLGNKWESAKTKGIIWGDSHSMHFAPLFEQLAKEMQISFVVAPLNCPPYLNSNFVKEHYPKFPSFTEDCTIKHKLTVDWLNNREDVQYIVMAAAWTGHIRQLYTQEHPENSFRVKNSELQADVIGAPLSEFALRQTLKSLDLNQKNVLILGDVPRSNRPLRACAFNELSGLLRADCETSHQFLDAKTMRKWHQSNELVLSKVAQEFPNVEFISSVEKLCNEQTCPAFINGELLYMDSNHIRRNLQESTSHELATKLGINDFFASPSFHMHQKMFDE